MSFVLLLGGARSGKSDLAQRIATGRDQPVTMIATAHAGDADMQQRIDRHRSDRPSAWTTIEEPVDLAAAIEAATPADTVVIDCVTMWATNLLLAGVDENAVVQQAQLAAAALADRIGYGAVVSNEVGSGVVPATELGRTFQDLLGRVNRVFAYYADKSVLVVAGQVLELQPPENLS